ncbi:hypothetical protein QTP86_024891, partial [Hemibagrus guttatus]
MTAARLPCGARGLGSSLGKNPMPSHRPTFPGSKRTRLFTSVQTYKKLTEVLCCRPCTKAARSGEGSTVGRWLAWYPAILSQLSEAHRAMCPAVLTSRRCGGKYRRITLEYVHHKDLYTTLLMSLVEPGGGIVSAMGHRFQAPPPPRELPSARLLHHAFLLAEANKVEDYWSQILSVFGTVLKMDLTKKVVKKLSGEGQGSAEWFTSIANEHSQIVSFVLTCEESTEKLEPMCRGLMERFQLANQPVPKILYVDRGCCHAQGRTAVETMFQPWMDNGMVVRPHCAAWAHQVYLISSIARWNADRISDAVFGGKGRHHRVYSAPLIDHLNTRCQQLFGETVEENFRAPADVPSQELLGLEYLLSQSTGESGPFSLQDIVNDGPGPEEEVVQPGHPDIGEAYHSDVETRDDVLDVAPSHITLASQDTSTIHPPAF